MLRKKFKKVEAIKVNVLDVRLVFSVIAAAQVGCFFADFLSFLNECNIGICKPLYPQKKVV